MQRLESSFAVRLSEAVAGERERWLREQEGAWQRKGEELLGSAHRQWRAEQEVAWQRQQVEAEKLLKEKVQVSM